jgi:hypothetical protein
VVGSATTSAFLTATPAIPLLMLFPRPASAAPPAVSGSFTWTPPALGRWRARATFIGTLGFSPSPSGYVSLLVAPPLPGRTGL